MTRNVHKCPTRQLPKRASSRPLPESGASSWRHPLIAVFKSKTQPALLSPWMTTMSLFPFRGITGASHPQLATWLPSLQLVMAVHKRETSPLLRTPTLLMDYNSFPSVLHRKARMILLEHASITSLFCAVIRRLPGSLSVESKGLTRVRAAWRGLALPCQPRA